MFINVVFFFILQNAFFITSLSSECWTTGCQLDTWSVRGCQEYNMREVGRQPCYNGLMFTCCSYTDDAITFKDPLNDNGSLCWETGCQLNSWTIKGCEEYNMVTIKSRPCENGKHYYCCHSNAQETSNVKPTIPSKMTTKSPPLLCGINNPDAHLRIYGGNASQLGDWPWMVALGIKEVEKKNRIQKWPCAGTLISDRHVLSAAHCFSRKHQLQLNTARFGNINLDPNISDGVSSTIDIGIKNITVHELYDPKNTTHDIALLELELPVHFNEFIQPICLPGSVNFSDDTMLTVAGWGTTAEDPENTNLMQVSVPIVKNKICKRLYPHLPIDEKVICAGNLKGGQDSCQGDSGGPLMWKIEDKYYIVGIVSYGLLCAEPNQPGVYTRVTYYKKWITRQIKRRT
ncbi:venom protease-like isoform X7 [Daktulosphaira vitifoliae]|uniref:venom protease-like isoform X1 n=1 Tax=Daktulosphaira vitifoliae TaxID=58002 RepID=UPI0021A9A3AA|nr:venom protease-like isoform X1 [Daktulosphaira vitifoliae]XP_050545984.1 venom protease-like isoform X4 [Daktulosphaira vitifoliae]XP_050545985.1 venom protease-like isoform X5 [Daktulosphaira vitifoliae]XP_050545987.1 venom protease-like isoform X6 [Daktulosphaira vitifoliae]XP_050545988.1 venom protease-like isoform X7 [Daktulosphaira vitifoliae]